MSRLPDFVIIGAQKAGTTWLARMLQQHPGVYLPDEEVHFFDKAHRHRRGAAWYRQHFAEAPPNAVVGEKTPDYFWTGRAGAEGHVPDPHRRLHDALPDARLVVILRDPVRRAVSAVKHLVRSGRIHPRHRLDDLLVGAERDQAVAHGVFDYGRYARHLQAYLDLYDAEQVLVLVFEEDVVERPREALRRVCRHIGADPGFAFEQPAKKFNENELPAAALRLAYHVPALRRPLQRIGRFIPGRLPPPTLATRAALYELYAEPNAALYELLGRSIPAWEEARRRARAS